MNSTLALLVLVGSVSTVTCIGELDIETAQAYGWQQSWFIVQDAERCIFLERIELLNYRLIIASIII